MIMQGNLQSWIRLTQTITSVALLVGCGSPNGSNVGGAGGAESGGAAPVDGGTSFSAGGAGGAISGAGGREIGLTTSGTTGGVTNSEDHDPQMRVVHASAETRSVDVYLDDALEPFRAGLTYGKVTRFQPLKAGTHRIIMRRHGDVPDSDHQLIESELFAIAADERATFVAMGDPANSWIERTLRLLTLVESAPAVDSPSTVGVRLAHASTLAPDLTFALGDSAAHLDLSPLTASNYLPEALPSGKSAILKVTGPGIGATFALPTMSGSDVLVALTGTPQKSNAERPFTALVVRSDGSTEAVTESGKVYFIQMDTGGGRDLFCSIKDGTDATQRRWSELADDRGFGTFQETTLPSGNYELRQYATIAGSSIWPETAPDGLRLSGPTGDSRTVEVRSGSKSLLWAKRPSLKSNGSLILVQPQPPTPSNHEVGLQLFYGANPGVETVWISSPAAAHDLQILPPTKAEGTGTLTIPSGENSAMARVLLYSNAASDQLLKAYQFPVVEGRQITLLLGGVALPRLPVEATTQRADDVDSDTFLAGDFTPEGLPKDPNYLPFDMRLLSGTEQDDCPQTPGIDQGCPDPELQVAAVDVTDPVWTSQLLEPEPCTTELKSVASQFQSALVALRSSRAKLAIACSAIASALQWGDLISNPRDVASDAVMKGACSLAAGALDDAKSTLEWELVVQPATCTAAPMDCQNQCTTAGQVDENCSIFCGWSSALQGTCTPPMVSITAPDGSSTAQVVSTQLEAIFEVQARLAVLSASSPSAAKPNGTKIGSQLVTSSGCGVLSLLDMQKVLGSSSVPPTDYTAELSKIAESMTVTVAALQDNLLKVTGS